VCFSVDQSEFGTNSHAEGERPGVGKKLRRIGRTSGQTQGWRRHGYAEITHANLFLMVRLAAIVDILRAEPALYENITLEQILLFLSIASNLREDIRQAQPLTHPLHETPSNLGVTISQFLSGCLGLSVDQVYTCWDALKEVVWGSVGSDEERIHFNRFLFCEYGTNHHFSTYLPQSYFNHLPNSYLSRSQVYISSAPLLHYTHMLANTPAYRICTTRGRFVHAQ
jgi:hypothetical protein